MTNILKRLSFDAIDAFGGGIFAAIGSLILGEPGLALFWFAVTYTSAFFVFRPASVLRWTLVAADLLGGALLIAVGLWIPGIALILVAFLIAD